MELVQARKDIVKGQHEKLELRAQFEELAEAYSNLKARAEQSDGESQSSVEGELSERGFVMLSTQTEEEETSEVKFFNLPDGNLLPVNTSYGILAKVTEVWFREGLDEADELDLDEE